MNGNVTDIGIVVMGDNHSDVIITGIVLGIIFALCIGAALTLFVMMRLRKAEKGEILSILILGCIALLRLVEE